MKSYCMKNKENIHTEHLTNKNIIKILVSVSNVREIL